MTTPTVYVICDQNCKFEGMTKEQILTAIAQAVESGEIRDVDTGFVTTIRTITGTPLKFFVGEQAVHDALTEEQKKNLFAIITNDTTKEGLLAAIAELQESKMNFERVMEGETAVPKAKKALVMSGCKEAEYDEINKGYKITEAGVYLLICYKGDENEVFAHMRDYSTEIIAIPFIDRYARGVTYADGLSDTIAWYGSYDIVNSMYDPSTYRVILNASLNLKPYKLFKIMDL